MKHDRVHIISENNIFDLERRVNEFICNDNYEIKAVEYGQNLVCIILYRDIGHLTSQDIKRLTGIDNPTLSRDPVPDPR